MHDMELVRRLIKTRVALIKDLPPLGRLETEEEGGCGVTGFVCNVPVKGKHIFEPSKQMNNRGNGLGGGIAAMGLDPGTLGVPRDLLRDDYLLHIAVMREECVNELISQFIRPLFEVHQYERLNHVDDYRDIPGLRVRPPEVLRFFVRVKPDQIKKFAEENGLDGLDERAVEDEIVYQNSFRLNSTYYDPRGEQRAFVLSHGRDFFILKIVGYAEHVVQYYMLEDFRAHIWIAHQRYPTKGKVWHPGGAHPFVGLNEALVHNGDFANYHSVSEYLLQRNIRPLFLTDTEVSVLLFDLYSRVYGYPLEYVIEALAPTMERDFEMLPPEKKTVYRQIQATHIHGSPDGPWFFIIARNDTKAQSLQLIGITDTSMLRPQVFALHDGEVKLGLICSEKQAIDATLKSLSREDPRVCPVADLYWNARGGSHTDGGAFLFELTNPYGEGHVDLRCYNKFGQEVRVDGGQRAYLPGSVSPIRPGLEGGVEDIVKGAISSLKDWDYDRVLGLMESLVERAAESEQGTLDSILVLNSLMDQRYPTYDKKRRSLLQIYNTTLERILRALPLLDQQGGGIRLINWKTRGSLRSPLEAEHTLVIDANMFPPEGLDSDSYLLMRAYSLGWKRFIVFGLKGQRFHGCGLGPNTDGVRIDIYGSSGDYLASGIDGLEIYVHGNAQDQLAQIMKRGKLVVYGDVGQTFMYGAKGGEVYVMGNAAGRPLINAVGRPRVVINGTCLDYLGESLMAGDPLKGGGFVVLNGIYFDQQGRVRPYPTPYPGSNLFSLASGGAIYVRDPDRLIEEDQLNSGQIQELMDQDWDLIYPYLKENERLFGIDVENDLLRVNGFHKSPKEVYIKIRPGGNNHQAMDGLEEWL